MRTIVKIVWQTEKPPRTYVLLDGGNGDTMYVGYGHNFKEGDLVQAFYDAKWDTLKVQKPKNLDNST